MTSPKTHRAPTRRASAGAVPSRTDLTRAGRPDRFGPGTAVGRAGSAGSGAGPALARGLTAVVLLDGWRPRVTDRADTVRSTTTTSPDRWPGHLADLVADLVSDLVSDFVSPCLHPPSLVHRGRRVVEPGRRTFTTDHQTFPTDHQTFPTERKSP